MKIGDKVFVVHLIGQPEATITDYDKRTDTFSIYLDMYKGTSVKGWFTQVRREDLTPTSKGVQTKLF